MMRYILFVAPYLLCTSLAFAAGEKTDGLPQMDVSTYASQIFWLAVMFLLMYLPFRFKILPDLTDIIERRKEQIETDLMSAKTLKEEAERIHNEYEKTLSEARTKSSALYTRVEDKIKEKEQEEFEKFYARSNELIADTESEIAKVKDSAMSDMNEIVAEVASIAAEKIVGIKTDEKQAVSIVEELGKKRAA